MYPDPIISLSLKIIHVGAGVIHAILCEITQKDFPYTNAGI